MDKKGVTLIEMLIVIVIIGIIAGVSIPAYIGQQKRAERAEAFSNLQNLRLLEEQLYSESGDYGPTVNGADLITATTGFSGFRPGPDRKFTYQLVHDQRITDAGQPPSYGALIPCFTAIATGNAGTRVAGNVFAIDCNNNRNF